MKKFKFYTILAVAVASLWSCAPVQPVSTSVKPSAAASSTAGPVASGLRVALAGDSIMGGGLVDVQDRVLAGFSNRLCGANCGTESFPEVYSVARGGQRLYGDPTALVVEWPLILQGFRRDAGGSLTVPGVKPDVIYIVIGWNDVLGTGDDNGYTSNYRTIVNLAKAAGVRPVPCTMSPYGNGRVNGSQASRWYWWNFWIIDQNGFKADGAADCRWDQALKNPNDMYLAGKFDSGDRLHPNGWGSLRLANALPLSWAKPL